MENFLEELSRMERSIDANERNKIALELSITRDPRLKSSILNLINREDLVNHRATLINSLGAFDNGDIIGTLVDLVLTGNWEVAHESLMLINNIEHVSGDDVVAAFSRVKNAVVKDEESWRRELIADLVSLFE